MSAFETVGCLFYNIIAAKFIIDVRQLYHNSTKILNLLHKSNSIRCR